MEERNLVLQEEVQERRRVEVALRESEERFSKAFKYSPDAVTISNVADGRFIEVNEGFERISGYTRQEAVGTPSTRLGLWLPGERERMMETLRDRGELRNFETGIVVRGGEVRDCQISGDLIELDGRQCLVAITRDVTELRRASRLREELIQELETKNAELERFTYTASHDLKSPLITIKGFLGLLEKDAKAGDITRLEQDIQQISGAADKMHRLLDDLLEFSRIGRVINRPEPVELAPLIAETLDVVAGPIAGRGAEVVVQSSLPVVFGDRLRLLEVFQNLVENAVKFMGDQPEPRIEIGARRNGQEVLCWVMDNGIGIEEKYREKIFGLSERLDAGAEGTGIGLTLVRRIVELHGGRVWVESTPGLGSAFFLTLSAPPGTRDPASPGADDGG
jgi:PAS domain S-box-containing protein